MFVFQQVSIVRADYPDYDGGAQVNDFEVQMTNPDNTTRDVYRGRELDCTVAGLSPGRPYIFRVRAHNKAGVSRVGFCSWFCGQT